MDRTIVVFLVLATLAFLGSTRADDATTPRPDPALVEFFEGKVRPVLEAHCINCHGPAKQKAGLRLDSRAALIKGGDSGPTIEPGRPEASRLIEAVNHSLRPPDAAQGEAQRGGGRGAGEVGPRRRRLARGGDGRRSARPRRSVGPTHHRRGSRLLGVPPGRANPAPPSVKRRVVAERGDRPLRPRAARGEGAASRSPRPTGGP